MPIPILMPALSPTMTEGTLAKWHKQAGDTVAAGDVLAEIETDKATMEVEAVDEGTLGKILVDEGTEEVAVNTPIAVILEDGESEADLAGFEAGTPSGNGQAVTPPEPAIPAAPAVQATPAVPATPTTEGADAQRLFASPLAKRLAKQAGIDIHLVKGTGPHGRIVRADIDAFQAGAAASADNGPAPATPSAPAAAPVAAPTPAAALGAILGEPEFDLIPHTTMRKVIARRLTESKQTVPHFYLTIDCQIDKLLEVRKELNGRADGAFKLSVNDFVIRAAALALGAVPAANASWSDSGTKRYKTADIAVAVAIDGGLITPVVRKAGGKGLRTISDEMKGLAAKAREGKLVPEDYTGGSMSVSNLGMFGVREFAAVINPPQGCILAVGAGQQRPVVEDGALAIATVMTCTLSVDHRAVDGTVGAEYLAAFKKLVEDPLTMLL